MAASIEAVSADLYDKVMVPQVDRGERQRDDMLEEHVPDVVDVKILMSHKEFDDDNVELYEDYADGKSGNVELRYLDYYVDYPFHTREVIRDHEAGWIWDHTFADAGNRHHTISQLRPVNLENDLDAFNEAWEEAELAA